MKKPRVALVMPTHFDIHSSLANFIKTYQHLIRQGRIEVTLFTDERNDIALPGFRIEKIRGIDHNTVLEKILLLLGLPRFSYPSLKGKLRGYDVITANNPEFYLYAWQAYKAAKDSRTRFILRTSQTVDGFFLFRLTKFFLAPIMRRCYRYAAYNMFTNPQAEERCLRLGLIQEQDRKKSIITGHATDTQTFRPRKTKKPDHHVLLSVGGLLKLKGHQYIIEALGGLKKDYPNAELWIVGKGPYEHELRNLARDIGLESSVRFLGPQDHKDLVKCYNQASVFVLANEQEITPAVNEALACEVPVVVTECGGREFVLPDEGYGLVARKKDSADLADKIGRVLSSPAEAKRMAKKGRKRILTEFSIEKVAEKLYRAFTA